MELALVQSECVGNLLDLIGHVASLARSDGVIMVHPDHRLASRLGLRVNTRSPNLGVCLCGMRATKASLGGDDGSENGGA